MLQSVSMNARNEMVKLTAKRGIKFYFWIAALLPVVLSFLAVKIQANDMITLPSLNISFSILNVFLMVILPLFVFMAASDLFAGEWERGSLFQVSPINRVEAFLSKIVSIGVLCFAQLGIVWVSVSISMSIAEKRIIWSEIASTFVAFIVSFLPLLAIICLATFISQSFKHGASALGFMILTYAFMYVLPLIISQTTFLFPTAYLDWYQQWGGNVNFAWLGKSFIYLFSFCTLFLTAGYYSFNTKEL
jgi:ABC-2 type transport system permease protein